MKKIVLFAGLISLQFGTATAQKWSIDVDYAESCDCHVPCPCLVGKDPTNRQCTGNSIVIINKGYLDTVNLDGLKMYVTFTLEDWSKVYIDESATQAQMNALLTIFKQPRTVAFLFAGKVLSVEKVPVTVVQTDSTFTYMVPASYTQIQYLKGKDGKPISLQNLQGNFTAGNRLAESIALKHTGDDKAFAYTNTHGMVSHFHASGEMNAKELK